MQCADLAKKKCWPPAPCPEAKYYDASAQDTADAKQAWSVDIMNPALRSAACPAGSEVTEAWMTNLAKDKSTKATFAKQSLGKFMLPGSHDAGTAGSGFTQV
jgi:hypothetical protein